MIAKILSYAARATEKMICSECFHVGIKDREFLGFPQIWEITQIRDQRILRNLRET